MISPPGEIKDLDPRFLLIPFISFFFFSLWFFIRGYMCSITALPNSEHFTSLASFINRAKS